MTSPSLMLLAQSTVVVPQMEGVTTAIVAFIFVCVIYPKLVKNRPQFYGAFAAVLVVILLHSLNVMIGTAGFQVFAGALSGLLQFGAIILLFLSAGGISMKELTSDVVKAYEVIRRGEDEKEVIIPIGRSPDGLPSGNPEQPKPRQPGGGGEDRGSRMENGAQPSKPSSILHPPASSDPAPPVQKIDLPPDAGWPTRKPE